MFGGKIKRRSYVNLQERSMGQWCTSMFRFDILRLTNCLLRNLTNFSKKITFDLVTFCNSPPATPGNSLASYKKFIYANSEDYGKEYLAYDKSIYIFTCALNYQFDDPNVSQLKYVCKSGQWILNGTYSSCVPARN